VDNNQQVKEEKQKESFKSIFIQFIKFGLVGVSNTLITQLTILASSHIPGKNT
jgi:putative flippase GtrA